MSRALRDLIHVSERILVFTGAGVSVDSGIPDFRSLGGVWDRVDPETLSAWTYHRGPDGRRAFWAAIRELLESTVAVRPNPIHVAVTELERRGKVVGIVTQNVDGLHQAAGSDPERVIEMHGNLRACTCGHCGVDEPIEAVLARLCAGDSDPTCHVCSFPVRPDVVAFGDPLPADAVRRAWALTRRCDLCLVLGSSLVVHPAAEVPAVARRHGARLAIVTLSDTPLDDIADLRLFAPLAESFVPAVRGEI